MSNTIAVVPSDRWTEAVDLLVARLPDDVRRQHHTAIRAKIAADAAQAAGLVGHFCGDRLTAVCWLERQSGRVVNFWPPGSSGEEGPMVARQLMDKALDLAWDQNIVLVQSLLLTDAGSEVATLRQAGFAHVADLLYLVSMADSFPSSQPESELRFVSVLGWEMGQVIERTYVDTRDCPALNGVRTIDDVLEGYRDVGHFRPELWLVARLSGKDIGCLLLADHTPLPVWELVYMGIAPAARGRGLGLAITRYAQWLAAGENVERLVLAVDAANEPAIAMYAAAGFKSWDRRSVFVRAISHLPH